MGRVRRRKKRFYWLPVQGINGSTGSGVPLGESFAGDFFTSAVQVGGGVDVLIRDITFDAPIGTDQTAEITQQSGMERFLRSAYLLRRVVGHIFVECNDLSPGADDPGGLMVTYFMCVARTEAGDFTLPAGGTTAAERRVNFNPQQVDNIREPYLFQRTWVLGNPTRRAAAPSSAAVQYPHTNAGYGSAREGTHVDCRTLRRIDGDNRLWHGIAFRTYPIGAVSTTGGMTVQCTTFLRLLGRPTTQTKSGTM